jgi:hypothetical protein
MFVLYEKATGKIERVSISSVKEPDLGDVIVNFDKPLHLYDGFNTADNQDVAFNHFSYQVLFDDDEQPYLVYKPKIKMTFEGDWALAHGWQRLICVGEDTLLTMKFQDEYGNPLSLSGELRVDAHNFHISDCHAILEDQTQFSCFVRGYNPAHGAVEIHLYPSDYPWLEPDIGANVGRPFHRDWCRLNAVSVDTFRKYANMPYYDLTVDKPSIPADGSSKAVFTITRRHPNGAADISSNETVLINTTRGCLNKESLQLASGVGTFTLTSSLETVTAKITVESEGGQTIRDEVEVHFHAV